MPSDRLPRYLVDWVPEHGKRNRGRPKKSWLKVVEEDFTHVTGSAGTSHSDMKLTGSDMKLTGSAGTSHSDMKLIAVDRGKWKQTETLDTAGNSAVT